MKGNVLQGTQAVMSKVLIFIVPAGNIKLMADLEGEKKS